MTNIKLDEMARFVEMVEMAGMAALARFIDTVLPPATRQPPPATRHPPPATCGFR
ncbi:MAG: hypothetical protein LH479_06945 [Polaromonas sp.]|nr:hypothetical protein [Polaromonas sp.]